MPQLSKKQQVEHVKEARAAVKSVRRRTADKSGRLQEALTIARETGLLKGARTELVRGRRPKALVVRAKERSGVASNTELIEVALAACFWQLGLAHFGSLIWPTPWDVEG